MKPTEIFGLEAKASAWSGSDFKKILLVPMFFGLFLLIGCTSTPEKPASIKEPGNIHLAVIREALSLEGLPYQYGGNHPDQGFDCSGFVQYVFERHGVILPRTAKAMAEQLDFPLESEPEPGDLVFFNTSGKPFSHVGIYLGENRFIHAMNRRKGVQVSKMMTPYWQRRYLGARRALIFPPQESDTLEPEF